MHSFSLVINTLNRGSLLEKTLESFAWLDYDGDFEVIVVNGPSTDNSDEVIKSWGNKIRAGKCDVENLSVSRNIGICMAEGDIVAFIDDDAIPEPEWLNHLAPAYDNELIGGVGGLVLDHSGYEYQYEFSTANRIANANWNAGKASEHFCFPKSYEFPYLQGTNASFRRQALLEVGGFDEEIEYYLDETELCCRLVDAGYVIRQISKAWVHHKFAPSHIRDDHKITRYRYPVIKNKIYFSLKHGREFLSIAEILADNRVFSDAQCADVEHHIAGERLDVSERDRFAEENERAWERGVMRGLSGQHEMITPEKVKLLSGDFLRFDPIKNDERRSLVFVSSDFPPDQAGGVATFNKDLAEALGALGHIVHVVTKSNDVNRVDFENGVWVHRMLIEETPLSKEAFDRNIPLHIWNWSATALKEVARISTHRKVDVVEAPIWDCEGVAFLFDGRWPLVTSLQTTLKFFLDYHPELKGNDGWMADFGNPIMAMERELIEKSHALRSISVAIRKSVEQAYDCIIPDSRICISHLGVPKADLTLESGTRKESIEVLFVGRLEPRKGIQTLLQAAPEVLEAAPEAIIRIIGDDTLEIPGKGITYREEFQSLYANEAWINRVIFEGRVDGDRLNEAYRVCDLFVAPSHFESFGIIFLEAMRVAKPVIGCDVGGIPEIVKNDVTGLLIEPGKAAKLAEAILSLISSPEKRDNMGRRGLERYLTEFTAEAMAARNAPLIAMAMENFSDEAGV